MEKILVPLLIAVVFTALFFGGAFEKKDIVTKIDIFYHMDPDTGLCFALVTSKVYGGYQVRSIANIPCAALKGKELVIDRR